jgi:thiamine pyrophosphokinase
MLAMANLMPMETTASHRWLIVANGEAKISTACDLSRWMKDRRTVVLDGAARLFEKNHLFPDVLLGDFDSVDLQLLDRWKRAGITPMRCEDQNYTDLEKAIQFAVSRDADDIVILNALGGRMDHALANIFFLKKYVQRVRRMAICDGVQYIECFHNETRELLAPVGSYCGFFGLPRATISSAGLKYEMKNFPIRLGGQESVANEFCAGTVRIAVHGTCLANYAAIS